jgi:hypothetical protein
VKHNLESKNQIELNPTRTTDAIKRRLIFLHLGLILVLFLTGAWQVWSLKNFFKEKKLID